MSYPSMVRSADELEVTEDTCEVQLPGNTRLPSP